MIPPQLAFGFGMPLFFVPMMSMAITMVPAEQTATAAGLINFVRSMSSAFATAIVTSVWSDEATLDRVQLVGAIHRPAAVLAKLGGRPSHMAAALQQLDDLVNGQSVMLATNTTFLYIGILIACVAVGVWLLPKPSTALSPAIGH
jgi:DHA2 family multidrug resistance protein